MTDLALQLIDGHQVSPVLWRGDLIVDDSLRGAVLVSLFTDAEASPEQLQEAGLDASPAERRGWWGDAVSSIAGDRIGSRLWLLARRKRMASVLPEAKRHAEDALAWLVSGGLAQTVTVTPSLGVADELLLDVEIARPSGALRYRVSNVWAANFAASPITAAEDEAAAVAAAAAVIEHVWFVEIPEITE